LQVPPLASSWLSCWQSSAGPSPSSSVAAPRTQARSKSQPNPHVCSAAELVIRLLAFPADTSAAISDCFPI
ncbi:hypothetical protein diail_11181, partial [Diaporthe ilicicola]